MDDTCTWPGCEKPRWYGPSRLCVMHLRRRERGAPMDGPEQRRGLPLSERFWQHVRRGVQSECWPWTGSTNSKGYGQFTYNGKTRPAHALAWELANGRPIAGWALHTCDNPQCCNPAHVYEGDALLNKQDTVMRDRLHRGPYKGRVTARGSRHGLARLNEAAVLEIRRRYAAGGVTQQQLAEEFGVNQTKISAVVRRKSWTHI